MEDKDNGSLDKLISLRKCLRETLAKAIIETPNSDLDQDIKNCLDQVEDWLIYEIRKEPLPSMDEGPTADE